VALSEQEQEEERMSQQKAGYRISSTLRDRVSPYAPVFLRLALGVTFLAAVTDRLGLWGPPGSPNVAWGNLARFAVYTATLNPWAPPGLIPALVWIVSVAETVLGCALILGLFMRWAAFWSGVLLVLFALGLTVGTGVKSALNASVFSAAAAALVLSTWPGDAWSMDALCERRAKPPVVAGAGSRKEGGQAGVEAHGHTQTKRYGKEPSVGAKENAEVLLELFSAIERRERQKVRDLCHADVAFHWPPSLPYGGTSGDQQDARPTWHAIWGPLQPTEAERRMDPRVVAAREEEVVVLWRQRGVSPAGERFDAPVLGLYQVRGGKLARAQMFYFDTAALVSFLAKAKGQAAAPKP
jgi:uncharacterized membrane protein YphA (DoxX/SURF4 family)/ketosteroid isomerase-like protein